MVDNTQSSEPSIQRIHGVPCHPGTTREMMETFPRLVPREKDIYVVSFPKAGTTWTQEIVWQILHDDRKDYRRIDVRIPWLEGMLYPYKENPYKVSTADMIEKMFESFPSPRVFKSHL
ncbi:hypothetical protein OS493_011749 [Desmophyllum pertusum]|uniref:Sulfotransferase domain-containing protein n=1 Tax=Desmophyllum pertusum TaxID=174260 RepID=A0A9W9YDZ9_9CNID|nr:hypothetical protein OS493_011749 [Desmophyllum pertusum]